MVLQYHCGNLENFFIVSSTVSEFLYLGVSVTLVVFLHASDVIFVVQSAADIGSEGGMHCIMTAMRTFTDNARLSSVGCLALWGLLVNGKCWCYIEGFMLKTHNSKSLIFRKYMTQIHTTQ